MADPRVLSWSSEAAACTDRTQKAALYYEMGCRLEQMLGDLSGAVEAYRAACKADPKFRPPLFALLRIEQRSGARQEALVELHKQEARAGEGPDQVTALLDHAFLLERAFDRSTEARAFYGRAHAAGPESLAASLMLELSAWRQGDHQGAERAIKARLGAVHDPVLERVLTLEVAHMCDAAGETDEALELLGTAFENPVERWRLLREYERIAQAHGRRDEAVRALEAAAAFATELGRGGGGGAALTTGSLAPFADDASARIQGSIALWRAARVRRHHLDDVDGALAALDRAVALTPNDLLLRYERMGLLDQVGDLAAAQKEARGVLQRCGSGPHVAVVHFHLAELARRANNPTARRAALTAALEADPDSPVAMAAVLDELAEPDNAARRVAWLEQRGQKLSGDAAAHALWQAAHVAATECGDCKLAWRLFEQAAELADDAAPILREAYGAALRLDPGMAVEVAERLLSVPLEDDERGMLLRGRYCHLRAAGRHAEADGLLCACLDEPDVPPWAAHSLRVRAALAADWDLLAEAHAAIAAHVGAGAAGDAHLCASARALLRKGDHASAAARLEEVLARAPAHPYAVALYEEALGGPEQGGPLAEALGRAAEETSTDVVSEALFLRAATVATRAGDPALTKDLLVRATERHGKSTELHWALGRLALVTGDPELSMRALEGSTRAGGGAASALALGEFADVADEGARARDALAEAGRDRDSALAAAAWLALSPHAADARVAALEAIARKVPDEPWVRRSLARQLFDHHPQDAAAHVDHQLEAQPGDPWAPWAALHLRDGDRVARGLQQLAACTCDPSLRRESALLGGWLAAMGGAKSEELVRHAALARAEGGPLVSMANDEICGEQDFAADAQALAARADNASGAHRAELEGAAGRMWLLAGEPDQAQPLLEKATAADPGDLASWEALRVAALSGGHWALCVRATDALAERARGAQRAELLVQAGALCMDELGQPSEAERRLRAALEHDPGQKDAYGRLQGLLGAGSGSGIEIVESLIRSTTDVGASMSLVCRKAELLRADGCVDEAASVLAELPEPDAHALALLADGLAEAGRGADAVAALRRLLDLSPKDDVRARVQWAIAGLLSGLGDHTGALDELGAIAGKEDEARLRCMAELAEGAGLVDLALALRKRAAAAGDPGAQREHDYRAAMLRARQASDSGEVEEAYRAALALNPTDEEAAGALAQVLSGAKRDEVLSTFESVAREAACAASPDGDLGRCVERVYTAALLRGDADLAFRSLAALDLLAVDRDRGLFDRLRGQSPTPSGACGDQATTALIGAPLDSDTLEIAAAIEPHLAAIDGHEPKELGVGRRDLVKAGHDQPVRDAVEAIASIFGVRTDRFYIGSAATGVRCVSLGQGEVTWVVGDEVQAPLTPVQRFEIGRAAMAASRDLSCLANRSPAEAATLLAAAARSAGASLDIRDAELPDAEVARIKKRLSRGARKTIAEHAPLVSASPEGTARLVRLGAIKAGLLVSGDLRAALETLTGGEPAPMSIEDGAARALFDFWLSEECGALRRRLGFAPEGPLPEARVGADAPVPSPLPFDTSDLLTLVRGGDATTRASSQAAPNAPPSLDARLSFIAALAKDADGPARARLLLSASELLIARGEAGPGEEQLVDARLIDERSPLMTRRLRRLMARRGDAAEAIELLRAEAALLESADERAACLLAAAWLGLGTAGDVTTALATAAAAVELKPHSVAALLTLAVAHRTVGDGEAAAATLERVVRCVEDGALASLILSESAFSTERAGDMTRARHLFSSAEKQHPESVDVLLGLARTTRAMGAFEEAADALSRATALVADRTLAGYLARVAARWTHLGAHRPSEALLLLPESDDPVCLDARIDAATAAGDTAALSAALEQRAGASHRTDKALALLGLARFASAAGKANEAGRLLKQAARADPTVHAVRIESETLARQGGDVLRAAKLAASIGGSPLAGCACAAPDSKHIDIERKLLAEAEGDAALCAGVMAIDVLAECGGDRAVTKLIQEQARKGVLDGAVAALLLGDLAGAADVDDIDLDDIDAPLVRSVARLQAELACSRQPARAAALWLEEASRSSGEQAGFAATLAALLLRSTVPEAATAALRQALEAAPDYQPALWSLEQHARASGDLEVLRQAFCHRADGAAGAEAASLWVRAAMVGLDSGAGLLERAHELAPDDRLLADLRARSDADLSPADRAALMQRVALGTDGAWARSHHLRAASHLELQEDYLGAALACRHALEAEPGDPFASGLLDRVEPQADEWEQAAERLRAAVGRAGNDTSRALALEQLAIFEQQEQGDSDRASEASRALLEYYPGHIASLRALERHAMQSGDDDRLVDVEARLGTSGNPQDASAHAQVAARLLLHAPGARPDAADDLLCAAFDYCQVDLWLARRIEAAARARGDDRLLSQALAALVELLPPPLEKMAAQVQLADVVARIRTPSSAASRLSMALDECDSYPTALEKLADLREMGGAAPRAAEAYAKAAAIARSGARKAYLLCTAARIWQEQAMDAEKAARTYFDAAKADLSYGDLLGRLMALPPNLQDNELLVQILSAAIARGGNRTQVAALHLQLAKVTERTGDLATAKKSLRAAAVMEPGDLAVLERLYLVCESDGDFRGAADALVKSTKLVSEPQVLRNVYLRLGDCYMHLRDARRARASLEQVLELFPDDPAAMERLGMLGHNR